MIVFTVWMFLGLAVYAQKYTVESYIDEFKYIAIEEMEKTGIPASITLAQGILESRYGNSELSVASNNHFGIKCHTGWTGKKHYYDDDRRGECFRVYKDPEQSYRDHSDFLMTRSRYAFLFEYPSTDYKSWAKGLKQAGYATNPKYAHLLIDLIERHQLYLYDRPNRDVIARNRHDDRNANNKVEGSRDYQVDDHKVNTSPVRPAVPEQLVSYNQIRAVVVGKYDNLPSLAKQHYLAESRLRKYNDLDPADKVFEGQVIYLQPKRSRAEHRTHVVREGETLWSISQENGVKLSKLYKRNFLEAGEEPAAGQVVFLNSKAPSKPQVRPYGPSGPVPPAQVAKASMDAGDQELVIGKAERVTAKKETAVVQPDMPEPAPVAETGKQEEPPAVQQVIPQERPAATPARKVHTVKKGDTLYSISKQYAVSLEDLKKWNSLASNLISIDQQLIVSE